MTIDQVKGKRDCSKYELFNNEAGSQNATDRSFCPLDYNNVKGLVKAGNEDAHLKEVMELFATQGRPGRN